MRRVIICVKSMNARLRRQAGTGMVEVLVALFILAVGLLGVLSMQLTGVRSNQRAIFITEAQLLAEDMLSMISAYDDISNGAGQTAEDYGNLTTIAGASETNCNSGCSRDTQVRNDRNEWSRQIERRLPGGFGQVRDVQIDGMSVLVITVMWDANLRGAIGSEAAVADDGTIECPDDDLACYTIKVRI
ncbi:MAG: type IV pilus modification protein PilV [Alteromonadaceae bacterium]|nr:MAG: type IV pilus modification protein PilV [Alteromonadaceae bacterium]